MVWGLSQECSPKQVEILHLCGSRAWDLCREIGICFARLEWDMALLDFLPPGLERMWHCGKGWERAISWLPHLVLGSYGVAVKWESSSARVMVLLGVGCRLPSSLKRLG